MSKVASYRADEETLRRLDALAQTLGRSRNDLMDEAVKRLLDYNDWFEAAVEQGVREADAGEFASEEQRQTVFGRWGVKG